MVLWILFDRETKFYFCNVSGGVVEERIFYKVYVYNFEGLRMDKVYSSVNGRKFNYINYFFFFVYI